MMGYRVARILWHGESYHAVIGPDGRPVPPAVIEQLARPRSEARPWYFRGVLVEESIDRHTGQEFRIRGLRAPAEGPPVTFLDTPHVIGLCADLQLQAPAAIPGTTGQCLTSRLELFDSALGEIAAVAIRAGVFCGLCCEMSDVYQEIDTGLWVDGRIERVLLGGNDQGFAGARILGPWEETAAAVSPAGARA